MSAEGTKGAPTRTRKEAEAARQRPLVPNDRKLARQVERQKRDEAYQRQRVALETGDERYLPARDKGKVRRYIRDWIDARWSISEFLLPGMLLFLVGMLGMSLIPMSATASQILILVLTIAFYGLLVVSVIEAFVVWQRMKRRIAKLFPGEPIPKGSWFYTYSRLLMARRWRSPKALVGRGEFPTGGK